MRWDLVMFVIAIHLHVYFGLFSHVALCVCVCVCVVARDSPGQLKSHIQQTDLISGTIRIACGLIGTGLSSNNKVELKDETPRIWHAALERGFGAKLKRAVENRSC